MHYVSVILDHVSYNQVNQSLEIIIAYIGRKYANLSRRQNDDRQLTDSEAFKCGVNYIDRRLHRWHKKALYRLIWAEKIYSFDDEMNITEKYNWLIHKNKASKIIRLIRQLAENTDDKQIEFCFDKIYEIVSSYEANVEQAGDVLIGFPYYTHISTYVRGVPISLMPYSKEELKALSTFCNEIKPFRKLYCKN
jgi:hypothetical protein